MTRNTLAAAGRSTASVTLLVACLDLPFAMVSIKSWQSMPSMALAGVALTLTLP